MAGRPVDLGRVLGALLGGAATPPRRRRRTAASRGLINVSPGSGNSRQLTAALGTLATVAAKALADRLATSAASAPAPRTPRRPVDVRPPAGVPRTGTTPWTPPPVEEAAPSADAAEALLLVRAAIAAARADGVLDAAERGHIAGQLDAAGLSAEERDFVLRDLDAPLTPEAIAQQVRDPMLAAQAYAAAVAGAGEVSAAERGFLDTLARALRLDGAATAAIEARLAG